ncbi:MAG TPA: PilZ domain-containing protein [Terriglobales bacterium]|nr:PilZ domain-containing protein [Terriglobales bacterium]
MDDKRRRNRKKAVLPVRVSGNDSTGNAYSDLVHTLDITESGASLGGLRHPLEVGTLVTLQYKQHRASFRVVWTKAVAGHNEHRVGLQALDPKSLWGFGTELRTEATAQAILPVVAPSEA